MFFSLFKKKQNYCDIDLQDCDHCENATSKIKKCGDCGSRSICKACIEKNPLCKNCDDKWNNMCDPNVCNGILAII